jgi:hypothetical protein
MTRPAFATAAALAAALILPSVSRAFFPPTIGIPVTGQSVPPDPFKPPTNGGLGEPDAPPPPPGPTVQTPEPASMVTALTGAVLAIGYGARKRLRRRTA